MNIASLRKQIDSIRPQKVIAFLGKSKKGKTTVTINGDRRKFKTKKQAINAVHNTTLINVKLHQPNKKQLHLINKHYGDN